MRLAVSAEVNGTFERVGTIETLPGSGEQFTYDERWVDAYPDRPLSLSLPVQREPYDARAMRPYFEGLLPEEDARRAVARQLGVAATSYLKLLRALAGECIGAVSIADEDGDDDTSACSYEKLDLEQLYDLAGGGYQTTSSLASRSRLSIAGAQAKTGLYFDASTGAWYFPKGLVPSTHVVKPDSAAFAELVANERWCMNLAEASGVPCARAFVIETPVPMLAVERYDRALADKPRIIDGLPVPLRLHQEDLCQALGVLVADKYEERGRRYLPRVFDVIREYSANPLDDLGHLIDLLAFNCIIGNCDAHLKNYGLLRSGDWSTLHLAPAYDLVSTSVYSDLTRVLGMAIGQARILDDVRMTSFEELAGEAMIAPKFVVSRVRDLTERVREAFDEQPVCNETENRCREQCERGLARFSG